MNPVGSKEQREKIRRDLRRFCLEHEDPLATPLVPTPLFSALDGLDIAEKMREVFEGLLQEAWADADVHPRHGYSSCERCDKFWDDSIAIHAKWDKWKGER